MTILFFQTAGDDANRFDIVAQTAYGDWTEVTGTFTTGGGTYFVISFSKYNWATDFYIDQIQLLDANGVDVLEGKGDFCTKAGENLIPDGDMESLTHDTLENWQIQNGSVENVSERTYGGNAVRLSANTGDAYMTYMGTAMTGDTKNSVRIYGSFLEGERALAKLICTATDGTVTEYTLDSANPKNTETYVKAGKWILFSRTIVVEEGTTVQAAFGAKKGTSITFDNLGMEILEDLPLGDANASGVRNCIDIIRMKRYLADNHIYVAKHVSDIDQNGVIEEADMPKMRDLFVY